MRAKNGFARAKLRLSTRGKTPLPAAVPSSLAHRCGLRRKSPSFVIAPGHAKTLSQDQSWVSASTIASAQS